MLWFKLFGILVFLTLGLFDLRTGQIPNWLVYPMLGLGLITGIWLGMGWQTIAGMAVAGGPFLLAWLGRGAGGGDVKLAAAAGAWCGWPGALDALFGATLFGLAWALGFWLWGRLRQGKGWRGRVPYGMPLAVGAIWALLR